MQAEADKGKLSAWERWELASFDEAKKDNAPEIKLPTAEEVEAIRQAAHDEGHQEGQSQGYAAGRATALAEGSQLAVLARRLDEALARVDQEIAEELLHLAVEIARQVVRETIAVKPENIRAVVRDALAQMPQAHATLHFHPEDASLVRSYLGDQLAHAGHRIVEDARLHRGDCLIESGTSQLDATVAMRWRRVVENLGIKSDWSETDSAA